MNKLQRALKPLAAGRRPLALLLTAWIALLPMVLPAEGDPTEILLWADGAPGSEGKTGDETVHITSNGDHELSNIHKPSITVFLPAPAKATGSAVVVLPGGGHSKLCIDKEGYREAQWLSEHGIAAFVLKYRLAKDTNSAYTVDGDEMADVKRSLRLVRSRASEWGVNPAHLGVMGFSAGGELAFLAGMRFDSSTPDAPDAVERQSCRPDFQALIYPGNVKRFEATTNSPPAFLACGSNDRLSDGLVNAYIKLKQVKVPAEIHIYAGVGHGFGFRAGQTTPVSSWIDSFYGWLGQSGLLKKT